MAAGKIDLTIREMQACLKQVLESDLDLTPEQRYSIKGSMEALEFLNRLSPGLKKALDDVRKDRPRKRLKQ